jgi:hypothetical protein
MKTRARKNRDRASRVAPINRQADLREIEDRAFQETRQADYDAPDDVLGPLMREKIKAQQPRHERESFSQFWAETLRAEPDEEKKTARIVRNAIRREERRERKRASA